LSVSSTSSQELGRRIGELQIEKSLLTGRKPAFRAGDIVYGYLRPYLNKVWVAEFDGLCSVDQYVYAVSSEANANYLAWFLRSPDFLSRAPIAIAPGQLPRIRTEEVAAVSIVLPALPEQERIAARIDAEMATVARAHTAAESQLAAVNSLPAAFLRRVFHGEL
jgi:type I restriction enzyme, S subunit